MVAKCLVMKEKVTITSIDNYDDCSCDILLPSDVTLDSGSHSHSEGVMSNK